MGKLKYPISNLFNKTIIKNLIYYNQNLKNGGIKIIEEYNSLLQKANTLKDEIVTLENHIEWSRQFQGEDMYEVLMGTTESILEKRRKSDKSYQQLFQNSKKWKPI